MIQAIRTAAAVVMPSKAPRSVATITSSLSKTVADLEAHAVEQIDVAKQKTADIARLLKERHDHDDEAEKAAKVAQNIKALLG